MQRQRQQLGTATHDHQHGGVQTVRALLEGGADVTAQDEDRRTPLHAAAAMAAEILLFQVPSRRGGHKYPSRVGRRCHGSGQGRVHSIA
jgi:hypothetical protein